ncbi:MAG: RNA 2'-phosphotransferase [Clostridia bacterium]|nr:RNA 2'-phosphotransferase [Clostridia bacterium]
MSYHQLSVYIAYLLRHKPDEIGLEMDKHGWVNASELIEKINSHTGYTVSRGILDEIVSSDKKGRYKYSADGEKIKACQGHSIEWVEPELETAAPPEFLYHGTTLEAYIKINESGAVSKMSRHAVHMQAEAGKAWQSARRWRQKPVVLKIDAGRMAKDGYLFGISDNEVWCTETVPIQYIAEAMYEE